jgi:hypothetical protein
MLLRRSGPARSPRWLILPVLLVAVAIAAHADSFFITGDVGFGVLTPFQDTNNNMTATFQSPSDPGGFNTQDTTIIVGAADPFFGPELLIAAGAVEPNIELDIVFNATLDSLSMNFGLANAGDTFVLQAYSGGLPPADGGTGTAVGGPVEVAAVVGTDNIPEGVIGLSGVFFDSVVLTTLDPTDPSFGISNIDAAAPEPSTLFSTFLGAGLLGGIAFLKRRRSGITVGR